MRVYMCICVCLYAGLKKSFTFHQLSHAHTHTPSLHLVNVGETSQVFIGDTAFLIKAFNNVFLNDCISRAQKVSIDTDIASTFP